MNLVASTWRGLAAPRRSVPMAIVALPMVATQVQLSGGRVSAGVLAMLMVGSFALFGPLAWRASSTLAPRALGLAVYGFACLAPTTLGVLAQALTGPSWLTGHAHLAISTALFAVGGWGLGRDLDQEEALERARAAAGAARRAAEEAQLLAVRSHLDPHFLFNTLNAIAEWCRVDGEVAERAVLELSALLRDVLGGVTAERWPLERELQVARRVWALYEARDPERYQVAWQVSGVDLTRPVPPLALLALVENAVKHGPSAGHRGTLELEADADGLTIRNPSPNTVVARDRGQGVALLLRRLELAGWPAPSFHGDGHRMTAHLSFPR